jgi:hypothetical protein
MTQQSEIPMTLEEYNGKFYPDFETPFKTHTEAFSADLEGYVPNGIGTDEQEAREAYIDNLESLIQLLDKKRVEIMYDVVPLEFINMKGDYYE